MGHKYSSTSIGSNEHMVARRTAVGDMTGALTCIPLKRPCVFVIYLRRCSISNSTNTKISAAFTPWWRRCANATPATLKSGSSRNPAIVRPNGRGRFSRPGLLECRYPGTRATTIQAGRRHMPRFALNVSTTIPDLEPGRLGSIPAWDIPGSGVGFPI